MRNGHQNYLYWGDNLDILRRHIDDESIDLIYLDPPFNSNASYNVLYAEKDGTAAAAQMKAFGDTWHWDLASAAAYQEVVERGGSVSLAMQAFRTFLGDNDVLAYLSMMAPRLVELHRVLKPSGSLYLHCDPTASHYLKLLLDGVFGPKNFMGEVIWRRTAAHVSSKRWPRLHDVLLVYARDLAKVRFHPPRVEADSEWIEREYRHEDERGRYSLDNLTGAGTTNGPSGQPWRGIDPAEIGAGRHWRYSPDKLEALDAEGRIYWPPKGKYPKLKQYLHESGGKAVGDLWVDIPVIGRTAAERLGYPTQKPEALLKRIIEASSAKGETVLDPFCGCGTAVAVAERLERAWIGIDITELALGVIRHRFSKDFPHGVEFVPVGEPVSVPDALALFRQDAFQFQAWVLGRLGVNPITQRKGADRGIDGRLYFQDGDDTRQVVISVKGGGTNVAAVRDLRGVMEREHAAIGLFITLREPTQAMEREAASAGFYEAASGRFYPRVQILTIKELLNENVGERPGTSPGLPHAPDRQLQLVLSPKPERDAAPAPQPPRRLSGSELADELLRRTRFRRPPVRLEPILEQLNMELSADPRLREEALLVPMSDPSLGPPLAWTVYYNPQRPEARRRFTIAHEVGHVLIHGTERGAAAAARGGGGSRAREREVDQFAAELLMPADFVRAAVAEYGANADRLRSLFLVSRRAMEIRLHELGLA